jgi:hypothetical protein
MTTAVEVGATKTATRLNWSTLRYMATSPKLLKWRLEHPEPETPALTLGRAIHCAILEPSEFATRWTVAGQCAGTVKSSGLPCGSQGSLYLNGNWYCRVKGHAPEGAGPLPAGMEVVTADQLATVQACTAAIADHWVAQGVLKGGLVEHGIEWTDAKTGIACRGRLDYLKPREVVDLKSTVGETVREIERTIIARLYYAQVAWYHDGAIAANRLPADAPLPLIVTVQTVEPYDVVVHRLSQHAYQAGQILYRDLISRYSDCLAADTWPGFAPSMRELNLPDYAQGMNGSQYDNPPTEGAPW